MLRENFVKEPIQQIVEQVMKSIVEGKEEKKRSYRNVCQVTGRGRGVIKHWKISRHVFRHLVDNGKLEGVRRASW